jgi:hypothetical protein
MTDDLSTCSSPRSISGTVWCYVVLKLSFGCMHDFVWLLYAELVTNLCRFCHVELYIDKAMPEAYV